MLMTTFSNISIKMCIKITKMNSRMIKNIENYRLDCL